MIQMCTFIYMEGNDTNLVPNTSNAENFMSVSEKDKADSNEEDSHSEMHVTFLSTLIIPPKSYIVPKIKMPKEPNNDNHRPHSQRLSNSARFSKPLFFDLPAINVPCYSEERFNSTNIKTKTNKSRSINNYHRRPLSARDSYNVTLDSLLASIEKEKSSPKSRQRQQNYNIKTEKSSSSRHSTRTNQLSMFQSKAKVQRPISPKICRNEFDKSLQPMKYRLNMKYPK